MPKYSNSDIYDLNPSWTSNFKDKYKKFKWTLKDCSTYYKARISVGTQSCLASVGWYYNG